MNDSRKGIFFGGILLLFLIIYNFRAEFYEKILENYTTISSQIVAWIPKVLIILFIFAIASILSGSINSILRRYFKFVGKEKEFNSAKSIVRYVVWILALIAALSVAIGNLGMWLTSLGLVGFGVTFALQKPILNMVGWFTILFNRTYSIGDRIKVGDVRGDVKEIQMMYTVMDGLLENTDESSGKIITVPNEMVLTGSITNFTKNGNYLWNELSVDITYESDWTRAEAILKDVTFKVVTKYVGKISEESSKSEGFVDMLNHLKRIHSEAKTNSDKKIIERKMVQVQEEKDRADEVHKQAKEDTKKEPIVRVELRDSSIGLNVRYLVHYKYLRIMKSEINSNFLSRIAKEKKIEIAYPHVQIVRYGKTK